MSIREMKALGLDIASFNPVNAGFISRSGRTRDQSIVQQQFERAAPFGAKHCKLPSFISKKACMVNIQNKDDRCLEYALICALHFKELEHDSNKERPTKWAKWLGTLKFDGLQFPIHTSDIHKVERMNNLAVNVYALRNEKCAKDAFKSNLFLAHQTKRSEEPITLFLYRQHFMYVHDWKRLTNSDGEHKFHCFLTVHKRTWTSIAWNVQRAIR